MLRKNISRALSVFLAVVMVAVAMPFAFAAEPVALTEANVVTWPTIEGEIYFGQKLSDGFTLSGGLVTTTGDESGTPIPGTFDFYDSNYVPTNTTAIAGFKFTPADEYADEYSGFEVQYVWDITYSVNTVTPVLVDENDVPVASAVASAGKNIRTSTLSGGAVKNPITGEVLSATWSWANRRVNVNESGYFTAQLVAGIGYETITMDVYVSIAGDAPATKVETLPSFEEVYYAPNLTLGDLTLTGGKAVVSETGEEIEGTFAVTDDAKKIALTAGERTVPVLFTPTDSTQGITCVCQVPLTVNKAVPTFKTDDGSGVPTITMPYGTKLDSSLDYKLRAMVDVSVPVTFAYIDENGNDFPYKGTTPVVGTHEIQVKAHINDSNYEQYTMLTFKLEITGFKANCIMKPTGTQGYKILDTSIKYDGAKPKGTFTVSYTIDGVKQPDKTVKYEELFQVDMTKSGKYEFSIKYNEIENDPFEIADITYTDTVALSHNVSINGKKQSVVYNTAVTASAPATDPAQLDKPYYGFAGWEATGIELTEEQAASPEFSFNMPDNDVELKSTYKFSIKLFFEWILAQITQFFTFIANAVKELFALAA